MAASLDMISSLFIYMSALFSVLFQITASHTGVAVTNALQLLLFLPWLVRMFYVLNSSMSSVSSLVYFGKNVPKEVNLAETLVPKKIKHHA